MNSLVLLITLTK